MAAQNICWIWASCDGGYSKYRLTHHTWSANGGLRRLVLLAESKLDRPNTGKNVIMSISVYCHRFFMIFQSCDLGRTFDISAAELLRSARLSACV